MTAPLFWRDRTPTYIRNVYCNSDDDRWKMAYSVGEERVSELVPSFHYLNAGEAIGAMTLLRDFAKRHVVMDFDTDLQYQGLRELGDYDLILVANRRTSRNRAEAP